MKLQHDIHFLNVDIIPTCITIHVSLFFFIKIKEDCRNQHACRTIHMCVQMCTIDGTYICPKQMKYSVHTCTTCEASMYPPDMHTTPPNYSITVQ